MTLRRKALKSNKHCFLGSKLYKRQTYIGRKSCGMVRYS
jgi:hypothetical protein